MREDKPGSATQLLPETMWAGEPMPSGVPPEGSVVVTISRQFGSGGAEIGRIVARERQLTYMDSAIIEEVARRLGVNAQQVAKGDEQSIGAAGRILEAIRASVPFAASYTGFLGSQQGSERSKELAYFHLTQKVVLEQATEGNAVIIGRGSQFLLHNAPRTLHIYVFAPLANRIKNVMERFQLDAPRARTLIEERDYEHSAYLRRYYGADGSQPNLYHLLINTGIFSYELAADLVSKAVPLAREIG